MARSIPVAELRLCALSAACALGLSPSCERGRSSPPEARAAGHQEAALVNAAAAESEPQSESNCRAIINVEGAFFDVHMFGDGREAKVERGEGNIMVVDDRVFSVQAMSFGQELSSSRVELRELPLGGPASWDHSFGTYGGQFEPAEDVFTYCLERLEDPDNADIQGGCYDGHDMQDELTPISMIGPYLSLSGFSYGFVGGAHALDESDLSLWNIASQQRAEAGALFTKAQLNLLNMTVSEYEIEGFDDEDEDDDYDSYAYSADFSDVTNLALSINDAGALDVEMSVGCCSWVMNHGHFELSASLRQQPPALRPHLPSIEQGRWERSGCGSVDLEGVARDVSGQEVGGTLGEGPPIGVYWLEAKHPFVLAWVPTMENHNHGAPPDTGDQAPGAVARRMMKQGDFHTAAALFQRAHTQQKDGRWLGEWGWAEFHLKNYGHAEALSTEALRYAKTKRSLGALMYNLGRIAEAQGDIEAALMRYTQSVEVRPNAIVQKQLERVEEIFDPQVENEKAKQP